MDREKIIATSLNSTLSNNRPEEVKIFEQYHDLLQEHFGCPTVLLNNFVRLVRNQEITKLMSLWDLFQKAVGIHGSIIEVGVLDGFNVFALAHFSEILEHRNYTRTVYGFDTFSGYTAPHTEKDNPSSTLNLPATHSFELLQKCVELFNRSITFSQFKKIALIQGDAVATIPSFVQEHPELTVSMLICQTDRYEPTKAALKYFYPRIPKGGIVSFVSLNSPETPGELIALQEEVGISNVSLQRLQYTTKLCYLIKE